jgi:DNA-binding MurR/RpiR family transcriptional regulator
MKQPTDFAELVEARIADLSRTEARVARHFVANPQHVLLQSAMELANGIGTSDATVIRTAKALGFGNLEGLRRAVADGIDTITPAARVSRTIEETGGDLRKALQSTLATQMQSVASLRDHLSDETFGFVVRAIAEAREVAVFGIGPSASIATYLCTQLGRFGLQGRAMTATGIALADQLLPLAAGDVVLIMAYSRVYPELEVLLDHAGRLGLQTILVTDTLEADVGRRVSRVVSIPRGRSDALSLHTATMAFLEAVLVGLAALQPKKTLSTLDELNRLRGELAGQAMKLNPPRKPSDV